MNLFNGGRIVSHWHVSCLLLSALLSLCGAEPPVRVPDAPPIPDPMPPQPRPVPGAPLTLTPDLLYVIDSDIPVIVLTSPDGLAGVVEEAGPLRVRGRFIESPEKVQTRTFSGKHIYTVEAKASGRVEVLVVPVGAAKAGDVIRRTVQVEAGDGPIPPPKPKPDPKPEPVTSFRVIFVYESADPLTPAMQRVMFSEKVRTYLDAKTTAHPQAGKGWRRFDKDVDAANERDPDIKKLWQDARPLVTAVPCVIVATNRKADIVPFPADEDAAVALFDKYLGGK